VPDPISRSCKPVSMLRSVDVTLKFKDSGLSCQPHKLDCRDGIVQDHAGAFHATAAIHRLAPYHYFLGFDREWSQRPHVDDYTKGGLLPYESLLTLRVPLLDFIFRHIASEGEIKSKIGFVYFVHGLSILLFDHSSWSQLEGLFSSTTLLFSSTTLRIESFSTTLPPTLLVTRRRIRAIVLICRCQAMIHLSMASR